MQLCTALFIVASLGLASTASAAPGWVDGPAATVTAVCGLDGTLSRRNIDTSVGYLVDPVAETPALGQVARMRVVVVNRNCALETVGVEIFPPPGARFYNPSLNAVTCMRFSSGGSAAVPGCLQIPVLGDDLGLVFTLPSVVPSGNSIAPGMIVLEVPFVFDSAIESSFIAETESAWGSSFAEVDVTVPYQPPVPLYARGDDLVVVGSSLADAETFPVAFSNDDGSFVANNYPATSFTSWSRGSNVTRLSGDFNHDGLIDIALVGGFGWRTIPLATSQGDGHYTITNSWVGEFGAWADSSAVKPVAGDFNRDGYTDIALVGGIGWATLPIAFSNGDGSFTVTNVTIDRFATWATSPGARPIVGDFNRDGMSDIALVGGSGWTMIPVAYSYGNGAFQVFNAGSFGGGNRCPGTYPYFCYYSWNFAQALQEPGANLVVTDFNKDGMTDLLVVGGSSLGIRFALSYGNGTFQIQERNDAYLAPIAQTPGVKVATGDFNKDGWPDLVLSGPATWNHFPIVMNRGNLSFATNNWFVGSFGSWAGSPNVRTLVGDFNADGYSDIAVTGGNGWTQIPVAFNTGSSFSIAQRWTNRMPMWTSDASASVFVGRVN